MRDLEFENRHHAILNSVAENEVDKLRKIAEARKFIIDYFDCLYAGEMQQLYNLVIYLKKVKFKTDKPKRKKK